MRASRLWLHIFLFLDVYFHNRGGFSVLEP